MNPWTIVGWILVGALGLVVLAILAAVIFLIISVSLYLRDRKRQIEAKELELKDRGITVPHFESMEPGDFFAIDYHNYRIEQLESDRDFERGVQRLRITASCLERLS